MSIEDGSIDRDRDVRVRFCVGPVEYAAKPLSTPTGGKIVPCSLKENKASTLGLETLIDCSPAPTRCREYDWQHHNRCYEHDRPSAEFKHAGFAYLSTSTLVPRYRFEIFWCSAKVPTWLGCAELF